jgi:hypothetical protein
MEMEEEEEGRLALGWGRQPGAVGKKGNTGRGKGQNWQRGTVRQRTHHEAQSQMHFAYICLHNFAYKIVKIKRTMVTIMVTMLVLQLHWHLKMPLAFKPIISNQVLPILMGHGAPLSVMLLNSSERFSTGRGISGSRT